ncbi:hypothetical protein L1887_43421 [Cichorium endivia]|nr:hypothetical protein L1887_43421 [Cichorium endivia]
MECDGERGLRRSRRRCVVAAAPELGVRHGQGDGGGRRRDARQGSRPEDDGEVEGWGAGETIETPSVVPASAPDAAGQRLFGWAAKSASASSIQRLCRMREIEVWTPPAEATSAETTTGAKSGRQTASATALSSFGRAMAAAAI